MARPTNPESPPPGPQIDRARRDAALADTLEYELTRAAARAGMPADVDAPEAPSESRESADSAESAEQGGAAETPAVPAPRSHRVIGSVTLLTLLNLVLSGFILMLWGVPRWSPPAPPSNPKPLETTATTPASASAAPAGIAAARESTPGAGVTRAGSTSGPAPGTRPATDASANARGSRAAPAANAVVPTRTAIAKPDATARVSRPTTLEPANRPSFQPASAPRAPRAAAADVSRFAPPAAPLPTVPETPYPGPLPAQRGEGTPGANISSLGRVTRGIPIAGEDGVTMPERLAESHVRPTLATLAGSEPVTGEVRLGAVIRTDGSVQNLTVLSSSHPGAGLEQAALDAVRRWRYKPATRDGQPVDAQLTITVTFR